MQISIATNVTVPPALGFNDLLDYAEQLAKVEGKDLFKHVAKMGTAAGDLAATAVENFQPNDDTYDEVAGLILRATIFGVAHGMTPNDLAVALGRETERLVGEGLTTKVEKAMKDSGFDLDEAIQLETAQ